MSVSLVNLEAEAAVLAAVLDPKLAGFAVSAEAGITAQTWGSPKHAAVWVLICRIVADSRTPEAFEVWEQASRTTVGELRDALKGRMLADNIPTAQASEWITLSWLSDLANTPIGITRIKRNAELVVALSRQRQVLAAAQDLVRKITAPRDQRELDADLGTFRELSSGSTTTASVGLHEAIAQAMVSHDYLEAGNTPRIGLWGISTMDDAVPLAAGRMIVLAAPPGCGKTSKMLFAVLSTGIASKGSSAFLSLEVGPKDLAIRVLASQAGIDSRAVYQGMLTKAQRAVVDRERERLEAFDIQLCASGNPQIDSVCGWIRAQHQRSNGELRLVAVDYLQKITTSNPKHFENDRLTEICGKLTRLAVELDICLLVGSQFSREGTKGVRGKSGDLETAQPEPRAADLRGSGSIEQDANAIVGLWRKTVSDAPACEVIACIIKNREGQSGGKLPLWWDKKYGRWSPVVPQKSDDQLADRAQRLRANPGDSEDVF